MGKYLKISNDPYRKMVHFEPNMEEAFNSMDDDELFDYAFSQMGGPESLASMHFKQVPAPNIPLMLRMDFEMSDEEYFILDRAYINGQFTIKNLTHEERRTLRKLVYRMKFNTIKMTTTQEEDSSWEALFGKD